MQQVREARGVTTCYMVEAVRTKSAVKLSTSLCKNHGVPVWNGGAFDDRNARFGRIGMAYTHTLHSSLKLGFVTNKADMSSPLRPQPEGFILLRYAQSSRSKPVPRKGKTWKAVRHRSKPDAL